MSKVVLTTVSVVQGSADNGVCPACPAGGAPAAASGGFSGFGASATEPLAFGGSAGGDGSMLGRGGGLMFGGGGVLYSKLAGATAPLGGTSRILSAGRGRGRGKK